MLFADYAVCIAIFLIAFANRQSIIFLCAFTLSEIFYFTNTDPVYDSVIIAMAFALAAYKSTGIKYNLQMALICYSVLFWFSGLDYLAFPQETYFYVIFPYVIKVIDIYVIYHLIHKEQRNVGLYSASHCSFN